MKIIAGALLMGAVLLLLQQPSVSGHIPFLRCESFGCLGTGIMYLAMMVILPWLYAALAALLAHGARGRIFMLAMGAGYAAMGLVFVMGMVINQQRINEAYAAKDTACAQYPQLCPPAEGSGP